jgi:hypothetical protein
LRSDFVGIVGRDCDPDIYAPLDLPVGTVVKWYQDYGDERAIRYSEKPVPKEFWPQVDAANAEQSFILLESEPERALFGTRYVTQVVTRARA